MPHRRPPHLDERLYDGYVRVFLTMCTFERRRWFADRAIVDTIRSQLLSTAADFDVEIVAYCFMPDHLHLLAGGTCDSANVLTFARRFRQASGYVFRREQAARLWQDGFFDHVLRDGEKTFEVVSYILANPVRAGIAADASRYPFSGSDRYSLVELASSVQWKPR